ncbi:Monooxygenase 2-like protein [Drosera capensis]
MGVEEKKVIAEEIVIAGAGIAGLATAVGLQATVSTELGIRTSLIPYVTKESDEHEKSRLTSSREAKRKTMGGEEERVITAEIVIIGGGVAGLATALGLHRLGFRSLVLESSDRLRVTGAAFATWTNAWRALDALGIGDIVRSQHVRHQGLVTMSTEMGIRTSTIPFMNKDGSGEHEVRCVKRRVLLETIAKELPENTIRFSSKLVSIEDSSHFKLLHLADGSIIKAKVVIGCDGVNSSVSRWLGFKKAAYVGRSAMRGYAVFEEGHGFEPNFMLFSGHGSRYGIIPCDDTSLYWFFTFVSSGKDKEIETNPAKMKEFVLNNLGKVPDEIRRVIEISKEEDIICSPLRNRAPWEILFGNVSKDNVCVTGDAFHPMTPDLGQGACSALEDAVVLARCLAAALSDNSEPDNKHTKEEVEYERVKMALKKYAKERKWRGAVLVGTAHVLGRIQQSDERVTSFIRDKLLSPFLAAAIVNKSKFDCGQLKTASIPV